MSCGIYIIKNLINNKVYIGSSVNIEERWSHHRSAFNPNYSYERNKPLYLAFQKYGKDNFSFSILEECHINELAEKEKYYIKLYDCCILDGENKGYNLTRGGEGYLLNNYDYIYQLWNNGLNQKTIAKQLNTDEGTVIRALNSFGIDSHIRRSRATKESLKKRQKPVIQYSKEMNYINKYPSLREASRQTKIDERDIGKVCKGRRKTAGGYIWKYEEEPYSSLQNM